MSRTPLYGIYNSTAFDGLIICRNWVKVLLPTPIEFKGNGVHRLALRMLYGEWNYLPPGRVYDLSTKTTNIADIEHAGRQTIYDAKALRRPIRWQPQTDFCLIETVEGTWILRRQHFKQLAFGSDGVFYLRIDQHDFSLTPQKTKDAAAMKAQLLADFPYNREVRPTDRLGFTIFERSDYSAKLVRDRFEFETIKPISQGETDRIFADTSTITLIGGNNSSPPSCQHPPRTFPLG